MYYEEKVIDTVHGKVLAHRGTPNSEWEIFTIAELTKKYEAVRYAAWSLSNTVEDYLENPNFIDDSRVQLEIEAANVKKAI